MYFIMLCYSKIILGRYDREVGTAYILMFSPNSCFPWVESPLLKRLHGFRISRNFILPVESDGPFCLGRATGKTLLLEKGIVL